MPHTLQLTGLLLNKAFFDIIPHKDAFEREHYEILLCINFFDAMPAYAVYEKLREVWHFQRWGIVQKKVKYLYENNYLFKEGTKYYLSDRSMLLIAQVERKLKKLIEEQIGTKPIGRPVNKK